jgi:hypothetical protein
MKTLGRQHGGDDRLLGFQLYAHQCADCRAGYKFMAIDAAIYHKTAPRIATQQLVGASSLACRDLERAREFEKVDQMLASTKPPKLHDK